MRLTQARIAPLADREFDNEQREVLAGFGGHILNIFRTMARAHKALSGSTCGAAMSSATRTPSPHANANS